MCPNGIVQDDVTYTFRLGTFDFVSLIFQIFIQTDSAGSLVDLCVTSNEDAR